MMEAPTMGIDMIRKRDGREVPFDQLTQMGLRKPRKCSIIKKNKVLLANNRLTKGSNG